MGFANSAFLWLLPLAAAPVLLHLFFRRRRRRVRFSTLQFFIPRQRYLARRKRLRQLLLLLLRTLALLLTILALAKPLLQQRPQQSGGGGRTDLVLVLDDSLSMQRQLATGEPAFAAARRKAIEAMHTLTSGDAAALVLVSGRPGIRLSRQRQQVLQALEQLEVSAAAGSYAAAIADGLDQLANAFSANRELVVISDLQANQLPETPQPLGEVRAYLLPLHGRVENLAVAPITLSAKPKLVDRPILINYTLHNTGSTERSTEAVLQIDGQPSQTRSHTIAAATSVHDSFRYVPAKPGLLYGAVSVSDPNIDLDNRAWFVADVAAQTRVLLLQAAALTDTQPFLFLRAALDPPDTGHINGIQVDMQFLDDYSTLRLADFAVVVLADPEPVSAAAAAALLDYVKTGGAVISFAGSKTTGATYANLPELPLAALYGGKLTCTATGFTFAGALAGLNDLVNLDLLQWRRRQQLNPVAAATVLGRIDDAAAAVQLQLGDGSWTALAFSARRDYSNWPELKSWPVVLLHLIDQVARDPAPVQQLECGKLLRLTATQPSVTLTNPLLPAETTRLETSPFVYAQTWQPGLRRITGAQTTAAVFQAAEPESQLATLPAAAALRRLFTGKAAVLNMDAELHPQLQQHRRGRDLAGLLLLLATLTLVTETLLNTPVPSRARPLAPSPSSPGHG